MRKVVFSPQMLLSLRLTEESPLQTELKYLQISLLFVLEVVCRRKKSTQAAVTKHFTLVRCFVLLSITHIMHHLPF